MREVMVDAEFQEWLKEILNESVVTLKFTKADGTERIMNGTTDPALVPEEKQPKGIRENITEQVQRVFDVDKQEWRSFKWDSLQAVDFQQV